MSKCKLRTPTKPRSVRRFVEKLERAKAAGRSIRWTSATVARLGEN